MSISVAQKCKRCSVPIFALGLDDDDERLIKVDCVLCGTESSVTITDFLDEDSLPKKCCGIPLIPNFWLEGDIILALLCSGCGTQEAVSLDDAFENLEEELRVLLALKVFH